MPCCTANEPVIDFCAGSRVHPFGCAHGCDDGRATARMTFQTALGYTAGRAAPPRTRATGRLARSTATACTPPALSSGRVRPSCIGSLLLQNILYQHIKNNHNRATNKGSSASSRGSLTLRLRPRAWNAWLSACLPCTWEPASTPRDAACRPLGGWAPGLAGAPGGFFHARACYGPGSRNHT